MENLCIIVIWIDAENIKVKWNRVRKEMREHILDIVERALDCGNIEKGY